MVCLVILTPPLLVLIGSMSYVLMSQPMLGLVNTGPHAFSEVLYAFSSLANNNGSAFAGLAADTPFMNSVGGIIMLLVRFIPMFAIVVLAHQLGQKKMCCKYRWNIINNRWYLHWDVTGCYFINWCTQLFTRIGFRTISGLLYEIGAITND